MVACTDASEEGGGSCLAEVSTSKALELYELSEPKGMYVRLDWNLDAEIEGLLDTGLWLLSKLRNLSGKSIFK